LTAFSQLDLDNAIAGFLDYFSRLAYLPFLSDREAGFIFGPEVTEAIASLDRYNREKQICAACGYRCCLRVKCEFYDPAFSRCLVESYRPALCRLHFCDEFNRHDAPLVHFLGDFYLESLLAAAKTDPARANLFDCPAFRPLAPQLTERILGVLDNLRRGQTAEPQAVQAIAGLITASPEA